MILLLALLSPWMMFGQALLNEEFPIGVTLTDEQIFDYIVVGAGAAGAAAAARLALANHDVLLIEAGGDPNLLSEIPAASMGLLGSEIDWQYRTKTNNKSCLASIDEQCRFSRGKCLGGSTSINFMIYARGNRKKDFQEIIYPGWTFDDLMPYFLRYEGLDDLNRLPRSSIPYHNTTGLMRIGYFDDPQNPWQSRLIESFKSLHFPLNRDVNAASQIGVTKNVGYVHEGVRMSTARGYLAREDVKKTLNVAKNTFCTGVIINRNKVARGVTAIQGLLNLKLYARKEVILSAGTIGTPQILMLSGIGPAEHLKSVGIHEKVDLPVGDGLTDHALPLVILKVDRRVGIVAELVRLAATAKQLAEFLTKRQGTLSSNGLTDINIFANTQCYDFKHKQLVNVSSDGSDCTVPNLQILNAYVTRYLVSLIKPFFQRVLGFKDDVVEQLSEANKNFAFIVMTPVLLEPRSLGRIRLASKDPVTPPDIYPNYLEEEADVDNMLRSIRIIEDVVKTDSFKRRNAMILRLSLPGCPHYKTDKLGYWRCYVRHMTFAVYHAAGSCALGRVVDGQLQVHGVHRLRVADLSVLPRAPRANTEAVAVAIGERVVDFVLKDNK